MAAMGESDALMASASAGAVASGADWAALKTAAGEGRLRLEPGAAEACARACDDAYTSLLHAQHDLQGAIRLTGLGQWGSGVALAKKFADKAMAPSGSAFAVLSVHMQVLSEMRDTFLAAAAAYRQAEEQNTATFSSSS